MGYVFLIGVIGFIAIGIIYSVATKKSSGTKKKSNSEEDAKNEKRVEEFASKRRGTFAEAKPSAKSSAGIGNGSRLTKPAAPKKSNLAPRITLSGNIETRTNANHTHPLEEDAEYRIERVDMGGSLGGEITEGCADQYFQRLVKIDKEDFERTEPNYDLIKTVVFGEMLAKPKFKK